MTNLGQQTQPGWRSGVVLGPIITGLGAALIGFAGLEVKAAQDAKPVPLVVVNCGDLRDQSAQTLQRCRA